MTYQPLPPFLTIKESGIHGLGLFTTKFISESSELGISHVKNLDFPDGLIRTPLGGFINHSEHPNAERVDNGDYFVVKTLRDIATNEEITLKYSLYNPIPEILSQEPESCSLS
tara:strand:+ start:8024 stop:8362 length:339 start_codon:yes stop_codon:yes gene_type:complete